MSVACTVAILEHHLGKNIKIEVTKEILKFFSIWEVGDGEDSNTLHSYMCAHFAVFSPWNYRTALVDFNGNCCGNWRGFRKLTLNVTMIIRKWKMFQFLCCLTCISWNNFSWGVWVYVCWTLDRHFYFVKFWGEKLFFFFALFWSLTLKVRNMRGLKKNDRWQYCVGCLNSCLLAKIFSCSYMIEVLKLPFHVWISCSSLNSKSSLQNQLCMNFLEFLDSGQQIFK